MSIADQLLLLDRTKADIKDAIEDLTGTSPGDVPFSRYAGLIYEDTVHHPTYIFDTTKDTGTTIGLYSFRSADINWGDGGAVESVAAGSTTNHTYSTDGTYTVVIDDSATNKGNVRVKSGQDMLVEVKHFGNNNTGRWLREAFKSCHNLTKVPAYLPPCSSLYYAFGYCTSLNDPHISLWDTSSCSDIALIFLGCSAFNQPLSNFDISSATRVNGMLQNCTAFNSSVAGWTFNSDCSVTEIFRGASSFNQPINDWDVSGLTSMYRMLYSATDFNQPLDTWDTSNVTNMDEMFSSCSDFDQDISDWCVSGIATKPTNFDLNTPSTWVTAEKPNWGASCS